MSQYDGFFTAYTHPYPWLQTNDVSRRPLQALDTPGLHQPMFFLRAPMGPENVPTYCHTDLAYRLYGEDILNIRSKYFNHQSLFALHGFRQQCWVVRLVDEAATTATMVLTLTVSQKDLPVWQTDLNGNYVLDANDEKIPVLDPNTSIQLTTPGIEATWGKRVIGPTETLTSLEPTSTEIGGVQYTTYPIMAFKFDSRGEYGNRYGIKLYYNPDMEQTVVDNTQSIIYRFEAFRRPEANFDTPYPIFDVFGQSKSDVSFKQDAYDSSVDRDYFVEAVLANTFVQSAGTGENQLRVSSLPYQYNLYSEYVEEIANLILSKSPELTAQNVAPFMINILTNRNPNGGVYQHYVVTNAGDFVSPDRVVYLEGGSDGDMSDAKYEQLVRQYCQGGLFPEIEDAFRYSMTHIYDSGYAMETKRALMQIFAIRDDIAIDLSTQTVYNNFNTQADDNAAGLSLRASALLRPESMFFGVAACRVSIYMQAGKLAEFPNWKKPVPANVDRLAKRVEFEAGPYRRGVPKERPNSEVKRFTYVNYTPFSSMQREMAWTGGMNYFQYANTNVIHYPDLRSVYPYDDSILSDDTFRDVLVYSKRMIRDTWTVYAGSVRRENVVNSELTKRIIKKISDAFGGNIEVDCYVENIANYRAVGWRKRVVVSIKGVMPMRSWDVEVRVDRIEDVLETAA